MKRVPYYCNDEVFSLISSNSYIYSYRVNYCFMSSVRSAYFNINYHYSRFNSDVANVLNSTWAYVALLKKY